MIPIPPSIPFGPLTMAKESNKPGNNPDKPLLQRVLKIDIEYKFKDGSVKFHHERKG